MPKNGFEALRDSFYLEALASRLLRINIWQGIGNLVLLSLVIGLIVFRPAPVYFGFTPELRIMQLTPLEEPGITVDGLMNWTADTVTASLNMDHFHWKEVLIRVRPNFSPTAYERFVDALIKSNNLDIIKKEYMISNAALDGTPRITAEGIKSGRYTWQIEVPVIVSYEGRAGTTSTQRLLAELLVQRGPTTEFPRGVYINSFLLKHR